ncbi:MAG: HNH endonuclease [Proteobacteria bacterium]|nr:HNH endonuclease [Pseudomonadota bacterium]
MLIGFPKYTVSKTGIVKNKKGRKISPFLDKTGYLRLELWSHGKVRKFSIHRLVAETYLGFKKDLVINHKNGIKTDNNIDNLEWVTRSENQLHAYRIGLQKGYKKPTKMSPEHKSKLCGSRWIKETHIYKINNDVFFTSEKAASKNKISRQTVLNRCKSTKWPRWGREVSYAK